MKIIILLMFSLLLISACGGSEAVGEPTPAATAATVATATVDTITVVTATVAPQTSSPLTASAVLTTLAPTTLSNPAGPSAAGSLSPTNAISAPTQVSLPVVAKSRTLADCPIPLHLDLVGEPDKEALPTILGCPTAEATLNPVAINEFGTGPDYNRFMLWFSTDRNIYVLFADQSWLQYTDTWDETQPTISCNPTNGPKTSPPIPERGFGKLWCTINGLRDKLGEVEREERLCQHSVTQAFEQGRLLACFEDATIRYFRLFDNGSWSMKLVK